MFKYLTLINKRYVYLHMMYIYYRRCVYNNNNMLWPFYSTDAVRAPMGMFVLFCKIFTVSNFHHIVKIVTGLGLFGGLLVVFFLAGIVC